MPAMQTYRALDPEKVIDTIRLLHQRICERFPGAGLAGVCAELLTMAEENSSRAERIASRNVPLRVAIFVLLALLAVALVWIALLFSTVPAGADNVYSVLQGIEAGANLVVLIGAAVFFLTRIEERLKRSGALKALNELRSIVHVIDMHQLTKDPSTTVSIAGKTASSPARTLSRAEVTRYLDYCSEMLSLTSKVAVLFAQGFPEPTVTEAVSDIERIAAGLSQKIWQKINILETLGPEDRQSADQAIGSRQYENDNYDGRLPIADCRLPGAGAGADPLQERDAGGGWRADVSAERARARGVRLPPHDHDRARHGRCGEPLRAARLRRPASVLCRPYRRGDGRR